MLALLSINILARGDSIDDFRELASEIEESYQTTKGIEENYGGLDPNQVNQILKFQGINVLVLDELDE